VHVIYECVLYSNKYGICPCCSAPHHLIKCKAFAKFTSRERRNPVRVKKLCFRCLRSNHLIRDCKVKTGCSVEGYAKGMSHHILLHDSKPSPTGDRVKESNRSGNGDCSTTETTTASEVSLSQSKVYLNVVPVVVRYGGQEVTVCAFLDYRSTAIFCNRKLMEILQATGHPKLLTFNTLTDSRNLDSIAIKVSVRPVDGGEWISLNEVLITDEIPVTPKTLPSRRVLNVFPHLGNVRFPTIDDGTVSLLLGADVPEALRVLAVRHGQGRSPDAIKTPLGWSLLGPAFSARAAQAT